MKHNHEETDTRNHVDRGKTTLVAHSSAKAKSTLLHTSKKIKLENTTKQRDGPKEKGAVL